jgi:hypothetical protein
LLLFLLLLLLGVAGAVTDCASVRQNESFA